MVDGRAKCSLLMQKSNIIAHNDFHESIQFVVKSLGPRESISAWGSGRFGHIFVLGPASPCRRSWCCHQWKASSRLHRKAFLSFAFWSPQREPRRPCPVGGIGNPAGTARASENTRAIRKQSYKNTHRQLKISMPFTVAKNKYVLL